MTKRVTDWRDKLHDYIDSVRRSSFVYGELDCALFAAGAVQAMTGEDPAEGMRGAYHSHEEGIEVLNSNGYLDHIDAAAAMFQSISPAQAQHGDLVLIETGEGLGFGVIGGGRIFAMGTRGLMSFSWADETTQRLRAKRAFRV